MFATATVMLAHRPRSVFEVCEHGVEVQISGHTHGGQYFPFTILIKAAQPYNVGLHRVGRTWLYVNPGSGYWGPPVRVGQPAEITLEWELFATADVDRDGTVGFADLLQVLAAWGDCPGCAEDVDGDGTVAFGDVLSVLANWS